MDEALSGLKRPSKRCTNRMFLRVGVQGPLDLLTNCLGGWAIVDSNPFRGLVRRFNSSLEQVLEVAFGVAVLGESARRPGSATRAS